MCYSGFGDLESNLTIVFSHSADILNITMESNLNGRPLYLAFDEAWGIRGFNLVCA